jgi:hypothetical protein
MYYNHNVVPKYALKVAKKVRVRLLRVVLNGCAWRKWRNFWLKNVRQFLAQEASETLAPIFGATVVFSAK